MNPSPNLFVIGPTGAGKTSLGRRLAQHFRLPFIDLDEEIEKSTGVDIPTIFDIEGEAGFRRRECAQLDTVTTGEGMVLATGAGAILDARNRELLAARGFVLWLDASVNQQVERLARDRNRPLLAGTNRRKRFTEMAVIRTPLYAQTADLQIAGRHESIPHALARLVKALEATWLASDTPQP